MKRLSMLLIPCIAISANAATFNAQGKTINSNDAKNPGIVKFEKNKAVKAKNNKTKPTALAKTYTPTRVKKTWGQYEQATDIYYLNGYKKSKDRYFTEIETFEKNDEARLNEPINQYQNNNFTPYPNKTGNNCQNIAYDFSSDYTIKQDEYASAFYTFSYDHNVSYKPYSSFENENTALAAIGYNESMDNRWNNGSTSWRCEWSAPGLIGNYIHSCGQGIGIYNIVGDDDLTYDRNKNCTDSRVQNYKEGIKNHEAKYFIEYVAERAYIHSFKDRNGRQYAQHPQNPYKYNDPANTMHIGNVIATTLKNQTTYNAEAAALDDYIYKNRVIEFVPYTENGQKTGAGLSLNAISVSGITSQSYGTRIGLSGSNQWFYGHYTLDNNTQLPYLSEGVSLSRYDKPEIYMVSNALFTKQEKVQHDGNNSDFIGITDSWGASTVAAAMTADLLQKHPFYKWHPEVVKALWLSAYSDNLTSEIRAKNTEGLKSSRLTTFDDLLFNNFSRFWYGNNEDYFKNEKLSFTENVEPGQKYAIAIAWLVRGDYALDPAFKNISSNFRLNIYDANTNRIITSSLKTGMLEKPSTFRKVEFTTPSATTKIKVEIERIKNTGDRIILGYNKHKVLPNQD